ncbi:hypothetical protein BKA62DRAFT_774931 [Auriculariales sp. MPI-PUGE-AT-0066]|nr:hypothetical protein BKA62DRAFT_774931 [Auriculariales sp. MPI-PUGE-AT-0066]
MAAHRLAQQVYWSKGKRYNRKKKRQRRTGVGKPVAKPTVPAAGDATHAEATLLPETARVTSGTLCVTGGVRLDVLARALTADARAFRPETPADWDAHVQTCLDIFERNPTSARRRSAFDLRFKAKLRATELVATVADKAEQIARQQCDRKSNDNPLAKRLSNVYRRAAFDSMCLWELGVYLCDGSLHAIYHAKQLPSQMLHLRPVDR